MCSDENGAPHAVRYLNAQLAVLHENARKCVEEHDQAQNEENRHFYALAAYQVQKPGTSEYAFDTSFDKPELEFICDHDAILHITLLNARLILDSLRPGRSGQDVQLPNNIRLTYRLGFESRKIVGNDQKVGGYPSVIELVILGIKKATFLAAEPEVTTGRDVLMRYMSEYFELLYSAGNHVLFSLPQFDQRSAAMVVDYSLMGTSQFYVGDIHGVTVEQINTYMSSVWLKSAMLAHGGGMKTKTDWRSRCLAEFDTLSLGGGAYGKFRMKLGPPRVDILCAREVIVYFSIEELQFFKNEDLTGEPERTYQGWKIAMVVDVLYSNESDGHVINIAFDLTHARYHHLASEYPGIGIDDELANEYWRLMIAFFSEEYLQILESTRYHIIYSRDTRWEAMSRMTTSSQEDADGSWWSLELADTSGASSRATIQRAKMFGFDQVVAISQGSINGQFAALAVNMQSIFYRWSYEGFFSASFKPFTLRFLSNNRAIIWVHLAGGALKGLKEKDWVPDPDGVRHEFGEWRLAFEVELKMCSQDELEGSTSEAFRKTSAYVKHGNTPDRELRHIYLDLHNAEYLHEYSNFGDLSTKGDSRTSIDKVKAVIYYITQLYFTAICQDALHVVSSMPVWKSGKSLPSYALTSVAFHVYSKVEITRHNWAHVVAGQEPIIVLFGMTGFRPLVSEHLDYSTGWIVQGNRGFSHGTISISKRVFIEERLLSLLSSVNALTTLIPTTPDVFSAFHGLKLVPWKEHEQRKDRPSKWELQPLDGDGSLKYLWKHAEEWRYNLSGNSNIMSAEHGISCVTSNYVELPTAVKHGALRIKISGRVDLNLTLQTAQLYTATSSVSWSTIITVQTIGSGIKVNTLGSHDPVFTKAEFSEGGSSKFRNPMDMLREAFPAKIDLDELVTEINAFEGAWQYCYPLTNAYSLASPVFNDDGDLLFELRRHGTSNMRSPVPPSAVPSRHGSPVPRRVGRPRTPMGGQKSPTARSSSTASSPRSPPRPPAMNLHAAPPTTGHTTAGGEFMSYTSGRNPIRPTPVNVNFGLS